MSVLRLRPDEAATSASEFSLPVEDALPAAALLEAQSEIIDLMASGVGLKDTLAAIALMVERLAPPALCSVLLLQSDGRHLRHGAGPSLPEEYNVAIHDLEIGPSVGSCGTAAYRKEPVIVSDIGADPLWEGPREFALSFGLRACWSQPVIDADGTVLGTIAMYYHEPRHPTRRDFGLLKPGARLVRLALAHHRKEEELRAAEARSRIAAEAADFGTFDIDLATRKVVWSQRFKTMLGVDENFVPEVPSLATMMHDDDRLRFEAGFERWIGGKPDTASRTNEFRIHRASDGAERILSLRGRILGNTQGVSARAIGVVADVTDLRAAERDRKEAEQRIHHIHKMEALGQLAGGIAHDLNNTLVPILGLSKLAMDEMSSLEPVRQHLALIHQSGERARDLVNQILTFSRKEEIARSQVDLSALIRDSLPLLRASIPTTIAIEEKIGAHPVVWANRGQIDQVLTNLVANAAQAIGPAIGAITIELAIDSAPSVSGDALKMARLSVVDDGPGIDPSASQRLFEPFFTTKRIGEGTGLGLAVVHGIVSNHDGRIEVTSRLGQGARFDVYLPLFRSGTK